MTVEGELRGQIRTETTPAGLLRCLTLPLDTLGR